MIKWLKRWLKVQIHEECEDTTKAVAELHEGLKRLKNDHRVLQRSLEAQLYQHEHLIDDLCKHKLLKVDERCISYFLGKKIIARLHELQQGLYPNHEIVGWEDNLACRLIRLKREIQ